MTAMAAAAPATKSEPILMMGVARGAPAVDISKAPLEEGCRLAAVVDG